MCVKCIQLKDSSFLCGGLALGLGKAIWG